MATEANERHPSDAERYEEVEQDMNDLGKRLHEALLLARRIEGKGVDMARIGLDVRTIERLRDEADNAFVFRKAPARGR